MKTSGEVLYFIIGVATGCSLLLILLTIIKYLTNQ